MTTATGPSAGLPEAARPVETGSPDCPNRDGATVAAASRCAGPCS